MIKSILSFTGDGIYAYSGFSLNNLVIVTPSTNNGLSTLNSIATGAFACVETSNVGFSGSNIGININIGTFTALNALCVSGCATGVFCAAPGFASVWYVAVSGCSTDGVFALTGGVIIMQDSVLNGNVTGALANLDGFIRVTGTSTVNETTDYNPAVNTVANSNSIIVS